ncbi:LPS assembly lipoprotein LptE [Lewinella sp. LCG006]|uniref:LPS assembly lipoprotein LptE n=1 Tax=Lewinella sp. LCG006 TaxID=3231911 RepID=UPI00345F6DAB
MKKYLFLLLVFLSLHCWQCGNNGYSFRGISIPADVSTYYVGQFKNNALNAPPTLAIETSEALKEKIRRESRLILNETTPDVEFQGAIVDFRVSAEAPQPGESSAINRLTIVTSVEYINNKDENEGFKKNFSFFFDFPSTTELASVQTQAIEDILAQLTEDIFNAAFTNW